ncbi:MAG TPA: RecX family transcriptional regulator [Prolixibacteraceae bacterium]|nr:RecX family transcriptional regulator [Prolixibacteraceae bacterium]
MISKMELTRDQTIAYDKAALVCSRSEKCTSEVEDKLNVWGLSAEESEPVIKKLISEKYLDNERFARAYAKDKFRFNRWGKQKIEYMLRTKKINQETVQLALEEITDEGYYNELLKLITDKGKTIKAKDQYDKRNKLMRFAMGRGFESGIIYAAFKELGI